MELKTKPFDCVEMKNRIQAALAEKYAGLSDQERFERIERELNTSDDEVARWWRKMSSTRSSVGRGERWTSST